MIKLFSRVLIRDGREGDIVDIYTTPPGYEIDFTQAGKPVPDPMTASIAPGEITKVLWEPKD